MREFRPTFLPLLVGCVVAAGSAGARGEGGAGAVATPIVPPQETAGAIVRERLQAAVIWLAAPEREGRGPGTPGIDAAADWVAAEFADIPGLEIPPPGATGVAAPFQPFALTLDAKLGPAADNVIELVGPPAADGAARVIPLELGTDVTPLAAGGSGEFDLPLAFAGYGITAPKLHYDDYAPLATATDGGKGHALVILRQEPQKNDPHSVFDGNQASEHAALARKVANASEHEAGAVVFVDEAAADDTLMDFARAGTGSDRRTMPVLHLRRAIADEVVRSLATPGPDLAQIQQRIDESLEPASGPLPGWRIRGRIAIERTETEGRNVIAVLPGRGQDAADGRPAIDPRETVVLGAHYDHLGYGGSGSAAPGVEAIHHGADDNASGTALLLEVARQLAASGPRPRRILFIAFSGEERGLLGSGHYTANPLVPLDDTVAMVNLDMVGRLVDDKVIVHGTGTGTGFDGLVDRLTALHGFQVAKEPGGFGPSDHASFYAKKIPVLHLFTGSHADYHRPSDTADKINYDGMVRIAGLVAEIVGDLADADERPGYVEVASTMFARGGGDRPYFGSIPDFGTPGGGYAISGVAKDSPAATGGLQGGDLIVRLGGSAITGLEDFDSALRKHKGGDRVPVVVLRDGAEVTLEIVLGPPK